MNNIETEFITSSYNDERTESQFTAVNYIKTEPTYSGNEEHQHNSRQTMNIKDEYAEYVFGQLNTDLKDDSQSTEFAVNPIPSDAQNHSSWHTISWLCYLCKKPFFDYKAFSEHQQTKHVTSRNESINYQCMQCPEACLGYSNFLNHLRKLHYISLRLSCDVCSEQYSNYDELSKHRLIHLTMLDCEYPSVHYCVKCGDAFSTLEEVENHLTRFHKQKSPRIDEDFQCSQCQMMFESGAFLKAHLKTHTKKRKSSKIRNRAEIAKERVKEWREKIKMNDEQYKIFRQKETHRTQLYRQKLTSILNTDKNKLNQKREADRLRQRKYRERMKHQTKSNTPYVFKQTLSDALIQVEKALPTDLNKKRGVIQILYEKYILSGEGCFEMADCKCSESSIDEETYCSSSAKYNSNMHHDNEKIIKCSAISTTVQCPLLKNNICDTAQSVHESVDNCNSEETSGTPPFRSLNAYMFSDAQAGTSSSSCKEEAETKQSEKLKQKSKKVNPERQMRSPCTKICKLKCYENFSEDERKKLFLSYWELGNIEKQRQFIANFMQIIEPIYRYVNVWGTRNRRQNNNAYFFKQGKNIVRVCKLFFKNTLNISDRLIRTVMTKREKLTDQKLEPDQI